MMHIDIAVENLDEAVAWAVDAGATLAGHQPQKHVRVMPGPAGHPFCLFPGRVWPAVTFRAGGKRSIG